jgi:ABC-type glutathione transport system ATPase component
LAVIKGQVPSLDAMPKGCRFHPRCPHAFAACKDQEPVLQSLADIQVRCLLYPSHQQLPVYEQKLLDWQPSQKKAPVIMTVRDLSVYFPQKRQHPFQAQTYLKAVDKVSFDLHQGQTLALVGESGSGKTTISRAILALLPIQTGEICLAGQPLATMGGKALRSCRKKVQIILQDPYAAMNPRLTVADIIAEGMIAQGMSKSRIQQRLPRLLEQVNLPRNSLQKYPHQFSGGQRQRICIARALATEPEILICDEPTSALDVSVQAQILNLLKELQHEQGLTYLLITHNMAVVSYLADHVMVMKEGRIIEAGTCEQIMFSPKAEYTRQLLDSVLAI